MEPSPQVVLERTKHPGVQRLQKPRGFRRHEFYAEPMPLQSPEDVDVEMSKSHVHAEENFRIWLCPTTHSSHHVDHLHHQLVGVPSGVSTQQKNVSWRVVKQGSVHAQWQSPLAADDKLGQHRLQGHVIADKRSVSEVRSLLAQGRT